LIVVICSGHVCKFGAVAKEPENDRNFSPKINQSISGIEWQQGAFQQVIHNFVERKNIAIRPKTG